MAGETHSQFREQLAGALAAAWKNLGAGGMLLLGCAFVGIQEFGPDIPNYLSVFLLILGTLLIAISSIWLGRTSVRREAVSVIAPLALPAFRRTFALFSSIGRIRTIADEKRRLLRRRSEDGSIPSESADSALEMIFSHAESALAEANNAFAEWEPIFPNEVKDFRDQWKE